VSVALSVNLNKIALLRNSRAGNYPDPLAFGKLALEAGARGLTVHPRPDQRHIRASDIAGLHHLCREYSVEFNIEGNPFATAKGDYPGFMALVLQNRPDQCTLVPDSETQLTSDHGFDLHRDGETLAPLIDALKRANIRVSLFMDPIPEQISLAKALGADRIELYTGPFAEAFEQSVESGEQVFNLHANAARHAGNIGLGINAGHDLNLKNLRLYRQLPGLLEVSIGHALTIESLLAGFSQTVKEYVKLLD